MLRCNATAQCKSGLRKQQQQKRPVFSKNIFNGGEETLIFYTNH